MIGSLIAMFILGAGVTFCICAILYIRRIDVDEAIDYYPYTDEYPYTDDDKDQMCLWYENEYKGEHEK